MTVLAWGIAAYLLLNSIVLTALYAQEDPFLLHDFPGWRRYVALPLIALFSGLLLLLVSAPRAIWEATSEGFWTAWWRLNQRGLIARSERSLNALLKTHDPSLVLRRVFPVWTAHADRLNLRQWGAWVSQRKEQLDADAALSRPAGAESDKDQA